MPTVQRFAVGGLGGLLSIIVSLLSFDPASVIDNIHLLTPGMYVGYGIKTIILIVLGGTFAAFTDGSTKPLTLLQIGIAAPALITSYINGTGVSGPTGKTSHSAAIFSAYAAETSSHIPLVRVDFLGDIVKGIVTPLPQIQRQEQERRQQQQQRQQRDQQQDQQQNNRSQPSQTPQ
jgi:hypothetical protein